LTFAATVCSLLNGSSRALLKVWMVSGAERPRISTSCGLAPGNAAPEVRFSLRFMFEIGT
jgi:hypothetical protein